MIDKLEFVLALAKERHFGRAAEACGVTQPTLSAGLKSLEDGLGILIVHRSSRFQGFTPEGERVLAWARRIVGDSKAMRQDLDAMKHGLEGRVRIAVIPTALPIVAHLTTPFRAKHPGVRFTILSRTSAHVLQLMENLEIDVGLSYLDNEPLGHVRTVPLFDEGYRLLTSRDGVFNDRTSVTWAEVAHLPLCLLTPDMQNRRIIDQMLRASGVEPEPTLVSDSTTVLLTHVRTGRWSSVMPPIFADSIGLPDSVVSIPIVEPDVTHSVGLVLPHREPTTPVLKALAAEARRLADDIGRGGMRAFMAAR
jgi:DNA-binding transcriptional LysR family regulator